MTRSWTSLLRFPGILGTAAFLEYLYWNIHWLSRGEVPPSILIGHFGIPCPTTGMTRSFLALLDGQWQTSLLWNPMTLPLLGVLAWTGFSLTKQLWQKEKPHFTKPLGLAWLSVLLLGQISKFVLGPAWW